MAWEPDKLRGERSKRDKVIVIGEYKFLDKKVKKNNRYGLLFIYFSFLFHLKLIYYFMSTENVFDPKDFDRNAGLILDCSNKIREHCNKFGSVRKVAVYDKHPQGICQVFFTSPEEADMAISMLRKFFKLDRVSKKNYFF